MSLATSIVALSLLALIGVTWPLWFGTSLIPTVPSLPLLTYLPPFIDQIAAVVLVSLAVATAGQSRYAKWLLVALAFSMLLDQFRWQAWAIHAVLFYCIAIGGKTVWRLGALRALSVAVYAYAALAKLDYEFATTLGQQFLQVATPMYDTSQLDYTVRIAICLVFPLFELLVGVLLAIPRTRSFGTVLAVLLHFSLALLLCPLGLNHSWGVVLWNLFFGATTVVLFAPRSWVAFVRLSIKESDVRPGPKVPGYVALLIGVIAPATGLLGIWDPWPSWALYAPQRERVELLVTTSAAEKLPDDLREYLQAADDKSNWQSLDLEAMHLEATGAPLYPGTRVKSALALAVVDRVGIFNGVRLAASDSANRVSGERTTQTYDSLKEITTYVRGHRLATRHRWASPRP